jgi:5-methylcytosine-specific restriction enzyme A
LANRPPQAKTPGWKPVAQRAKEIRARAEIGRLSASERGYDANWRKAKAEFLARPENRFCACGCGRLANMVNHRIAHKGDMKLFWNRSNWQPFNNRCNSRVCAEREGGFGNVFKPVL